MLLAVNYVDMIHQYIAHFNSNGNKEVFFLSFSKVLSNWQRFRDEQMILLNWLSNKEKTLKEMARTDLTDEAEVKDHLEKLRVSVNHVLTSFALCPSPRFRQNWDQHLKFALTNPLTALL